MRADLGRATALGPAVAASLVISNQEQFNSQIVILTDGMANFGFGAFYDQNAPYSMKIEALNAHAEKTYKELGQASF